MNLQIRPEDRSDADAISELITRAFETAEHSDGNEAAIVEKLRERGELSVSLVATLDDQIVGHAAASPVLVSGARLDWYGLAPVSVAPELQGRGIGRMLIDAALANLASAAGIVVLGDPQYYSRFGFEVSPELTLPGVPPEYFQARLLSASVFPNGEVSFSEAFGS